MLAKPSSCSRRKLSKIPKRMIRQLTLRSGLSQYMPTARPSSSFRSILAGRGIPTWLMAVMDMVKIEILPTSSATARSPPVWLHSRCTKWCFASVGVRGKIGKSLLSPHFAVAVWNLRQRNLTSSPSGEIYATPPWRDQAIFLSTHTSASRTSSTEPRTS